MAAPPRTDEIEGAILGLLAGRREGATICPSEAARRLRPDDWRPLMEPVRATAARLAAEGRLRITQKGREVAPGEARGPIRLALPHDPA